ncbi:hypothetical protein SAMN04487926_127104 [Paraburkholderia steynii]|uniref:Uncharacterized protein n=1 Tax=Paraburkholderia steynii TaxID=1245441 RepID=A0A7Z7BEP8_9BURK|nr:hypothetical protein SAMN04487926_127104 [Paraburkholderia steynii]
MDEKSINERLARSECRVEGARCDRWLAVETLSQMLVLMLLPCATKSRIWSARAFELISNECSNTATMSLFQTPFEMPC